MPTWNFDKQNFDELIVCRFHRRNKKGENFSKKNFDESLAICQIH